MGRTGTLILRNKRYHLRYVIGGIQFQIPLNTSSEAQAEKLKARFMRDRQGGLDQYEHFLKGELAQINKERNGAAAQSITLSGAWEAFLQSPKRPRAGAGTLAHYKSAWNAFLFNFEPEQATVTILDVSNLDATTRMEQLEASNLSQSTVEKHLIYLKAIFNALLPDGYDNPFKDAVARGATVQASYRPLSDEQMRAILQAAKAEKCPDVHLLMLILAYTGLRLVDAATLRWEEVHFDRKVIVRVPEKTKRYATTRNAATAKIGLHPVLCEALSIHPSYAADEEVLLVSKWSPARRSAAIQRIFKAAGIDQSVERANGRSTSLYGASSFRHSMEDRLREHGTPQAVINTILCHSDRSMCAVYSTVRDSEVYDAIAGAYPDFLTNEKDQGLDAPKGTL